MPSGAVIYFLNWRPLISVGSSHIEQISSWIIENTLKSCQELRVKARKDRKDRPFYNLLHKRPMQYTNTAKGNSSTL